MPNPSEYSTEEEWMSACMSTANDEGLDHEAAVGKCMGMWRDHKSVTVTPVLDETLINAAKHIDIDDALVAYGTEIKSLDNGHIAGYLVKFSDETRPDLAGEYFDKRTDFGAAKRTPVYFNHRMPIKNSNGDEFSIKKVIGEGELTVDDVGVFVDAVLYSRDEYEKALNTLAKTRKLGWSSGTAPHLVDREPKGNATLIKTWPLGLDASITPTPAEPTNQVISLKSLSALDKTANEPKQNSVPEAVTTAVQEVEAQAKNPTNPTQEVKTMDEKEIQALVAATAKQAADEAVKAYQATLPAVNAAGVQVVKDESDQPWESDGKFFMAVKTFAYYPDHIDPRLLALKAPTGLNEAIPSQGGFLVPPKINAGILQNMMAPGTLLGLIPHDQVEGNSMTWNVVDETSHASGSRYGGITSYWLNEAGTYTSSKPKFRQLELKLKKLTALVYATDEQLEDASMLGGWLQREVPQELRFETEYQIVNGTGVGKPQGILGCAAYKSATRTDASEIDPLDIGRMWAGRYSGVNDYVWLVNPTVFPQLLNFSIGNMPVYTAPGGISGLPNGTILGRPVVELEYMPALGTLGDITLFSPSQYKFIEKATGIQSASSIHVAFTTGEQCFRFTYRCDGAPLWYTTLTGVDTNTYSPYVGLAATT